MNTKRVRCTLFESSKAAATRGDSVPTGECNSRGIPVTTYRYLPSRQLWQLHGFFVPSYHCCKHFFPFPLSLSFSFSTLFDFLQLLQVLNSVPLRKRDKQNSVWGYLGPHFTHQRTGQTTRANHNKHSHIAACLHQSSSSNMPWSVRRPPTLRPTMYIPYRRQRLLLAVVVKSAHPARPLRQPTSIAIRNNSSSLLRLPLPLPLPLPQRPFLPLIPPLGTSPRRNWCSHRSSKAL